MIGNTWAVLGGSFQQRLALNISFVKAPMDRETSRPLMYISHFQVVATF
jgi:hypothetical protein